MFSNNIDLTGLKMSKKPTSVMRYELDELHLSFEEAVELLKQPAFPWKHFGKIFPLGARIYREGEYEQLLNLAVDALPSDLAREMLLDVLDAQQIVLLEQSLLILEGLGDNGSPDRHKFEGAAEFASSFLGISRGVRHRLGLKRQYGWKADSWHQSAFNIMCSRDVGPD